LRPAFPQNDLEVVAGDPHLGNRILGHDATIVFDLHFELIVRQDALAQLEDFGEPIRPQAMIGILPNVRLEQNGLVFAGHASAIDEVFRDVSHFGDVGMGRDKIAAGQDEARIGGWIFSED